MGYSSLGGDSMLRGSGVKHRCDRVAARVRRRHVRRTWPDPAPVDDQVPAVGVRAVRSGGARSADPTRCRPHRARRRHGAGRGEPARRPALHRPVRRGVRRRRAALPGAGGGGGPPGPHAAPADEPTGWIAAFRMHAVIRTRLFDDHLCDAVRGGIRQVVLLAAGVDARAYRLAWPPGTRVYELDLPEVLHFKQQVLDARSVAARCDRRAVDVDLRVDWAGPLVDAGFRAAAPSAWLAEGLLAYLSAAEATRMLTTVGRLSARDTRLACDTAAGGSAPMRHGAGALPGVASYAAMWQDGMPEVTGWLAAHGWRSARHRGADVATRYGRAAGDLPPLGDFVTATRTRDRPTGNRTAP
ncbi:MAG TPA: SAM-dependent methyltransferase [Pilimelia sp.]|nr:SAM-dependent methyltransferase [Pilimelia sp.]